MMQNVYDEKTDLWYERHGDYYFPCVTAPTLSPIGIWGQRRLQFLREHENGIYTGMLLQGTLNNHLTQIDRQAEVMYQNLVNELARIEHVTEQLKAEDQLAWVGKMNNIRERVSEIILSELNYV